MTRGRLYAMTLANEDRKLGAVDDEHQHDTDSTPKLN
jgi:hypothetical protein